jgi:hypothetical protein
VLLQTAFVLPKTLSTQNPLRLYAFLKSVSQRNAEKLIFFFVLLSERSLKLILRNVYMRFYEAFLRETLRKFSFRFLRFSTRAVDENDSIQRL